MLFFYLDIELDNDQSAVETSFAFTRLFILNCLKKPLLILWESNVYLSTCSWLPSNVALIFPFLQLLVDASIINVSTEYVTFHTSRKNRVHLN